MAEVCTLCPSSITYRRGGTYLPIKDKAQELFHRPCSTCSQEPQDSRLCAKCRHLRIKHLVRCGVSRSDLLFTTFFFRQDILALSFASVCPLCLIVRHTIEGAMSEEEISNIRNISFDISLSLTEYPQMSSPTVNINDRRSRQSENWVWPRSYPIVFVDVTEGGCQSIVPSMKTLSPAFRQG